MITADHEAEQAILGCILLGTTSADATGLDAEDFYDLTHGRVFHAMLEVERSGLNACGLLVAAQMRATEKERAYLASVGACVPFAGNAQAYARIVGDLAYMRQVVRDMHVVADRIRDRDRAGVEESIEQLQSRRRMADVVPIRKAAS